MLREAKEVLDDIHSDLRAIRDEILPQNDTSEPELDLNLMEIISHTIFRSMHGGSLRYEGAPREEAMRAALAVAHVIQEELGDDVLSS